MDDTKYLLVFVIGTGFGGELLRFACRINGELWNKKQMEYYAENNALKEHMNLPSHMKIVRTEELDGVIK